LNSRTPDQNSITLVLNDPQKAPSDAPLASLLPKQLLVAAEAFSNDQMCQSGALTTRSGFMPDSPPPLELPEQLAALDLAALELPDSFHSKRTAVVISNINFSQMPMPTDFRALGRLSTILGFLAHAVVRESKATESILPSAFLAYWKKCSSRLGRSTPILSYGDLILNNFIESIRALALLDRPRCE
jgi:hypothetical protein